MKRIGSALILLLLCTVLVLPATAAFSNPAVIDEAGCLTEAQAAELTQRLNELRQRYDFDVAIYIEEKMTADTARDAADDIFDYNGYGAGKNADGILLYLSKEPRKYHMSTHGSGIKAFTDNGLIYMEEQFLPYLKEDDYYAALSAYVDCADELLNMAAQGEPYNKPQRSMTNPAVIDEAGYLTEAQAAELTQRLNELRQRYDFDVAIYIEEKMTADTARDAADDIFDYNGYGAGKNADGILLYLSKEPRKYHMSTHGSGIKAFTDNGLIYMEEQFLPYLKEDDYYAALSAYVDCADELLNMAAQGEPYNKPQRSMTYILCVIAGAILLPLIVAYFAMKSKLAKMKTAVKQDYAGNYMKPGSFHLDFSQDIFLYSTVSKTEKPDDDSSSSTHTSSSGETHGGRGGSY